MVPMIDPIAWPPSAGAASTMHDAAAEPRRFERRGHTRDARADDADVRFDRGNGSPRRAAQGA